MYGMESYHDMNDERADLVYAVREIGLSNIYKTQYFQPKYPWFLHKTFVATSNGCAVLPFPRPLINSIPYLTFVMRISDLETICLRFIWKIDGRLVQT